MLSYLALINLVLAVFNLLPGFPLDGGRVLRSILWGTTGSLTRATNIAATVGRFFGWGLIALGFFQLLSGNIIGGIWIAFIGWFLSNTAAASRKELTLREHLSGIKVGEVMNPNPGTISPDTPVEAVVEDIFRKRYGRAVPVCQDDRLVGIVTVTDIRELPQDKWAETPVAQIMTQSPLYTVSPADSLQEALKLIAQHDINQVLIKHQDRCAGVLSRADIIGYLQFSQELGTGRKSA
jgi:CBS domain-containing protein